jgi:hypothetical protein
MTNESQLVVEKLTALERDLIDKIVNLNFRIERQRDPKQLARLRVERVKLINELNK